MPDILKQTLYWNANPGSTVTDIQNSGASQLRAITAAESHDASDATYARLNCSGDGLSVEGEATNDVEGALQTASVSGTISFLRFIFRHKVAKSTGSGSASGSHQPRINGVARGSAASSSGSFAESSQDFATDPADAAAWTNAKINAQTFGIQQYALTNDPGVYLTNARADLSEFRVEVWGPPLPQTSTPASVSATATVNAATGVPGLRTVTPASVAMTAAVSPGPDSFANTALRDPSAVTSLAATADGDATPTTLRSNTSSLNDENLATGTGDTDGFGVPGTATGTLTASGGTGFQSASIEGSGAISGVVFYGFARGRKDAHVTLSNWRLCGQAISAPPVGNTTPPYADFGIVSTALLTVDGGGLPWDWSTIFSKLVGPALYGMQADYSFSGGHEFDESVTIELAELWCEVRGPIGSTPDVIELRQVIASHRKTFPMRAKV